MTTKKFFFDQDPEAENSTELTDKEHSDTFSSEIGVDVDLAPDTIEVDGSMQFIENKVMRIEYGLYQKNYSITFTPHNQNYNIKSDDDVDTIVIELMKLFSKYIPKTTKVNVFLPRTDWELKVFSFVVVDGATDWSFDITHFESEVPKAALDLVTQFIIKSKR